MSDADAFDQEGHVSYPEHVASFDRFFRENKESLLRYLVARTRTVYDADEILMQATLRIYQRWAYIEASGNTMGLVRTIVYGFMVDHYRHQARTAGREILTDDLRPYATDGGTVDDLLKQRGYDELDDAMATLERIAPVQARCIRLHYLEDLTPAEIAERTGSTPSAVRTNLSKGRRRLHRLLRPTRKEGDQ